MLPADFCNLKHDVRTLSTGLPFPRRDDGHDHLPFLTRHARPSRVRSGDTRRAALRPSTKTPVPVPPTFVGLPDRDIWSAVIDVHGSLD